MNRLQSVLLAWSLGLALSMVLYGALVKTTVLGGSDGFNVGRPTLFGAVFNDPREADFMLYAVSVVATGIDLPAERAAPAQVAAQNILPPSVRGSAG